MHTQFNNIDKINKSFYLKSKKKPNNEIILKALAKLGEEYGELVQGVNMTVGVKSTNKTKNEIIANIREESADLIQNVFSICAMLGINYDDLVKELDIKNDKWKSKKSKKKQEVVQLIKS